MRRSLLFLLPLLLLPFLVKSQLTPAVDSIPMRDGKKLAADIHLPSGPGPWPVILIQTPYNRLNFRLGLPLGTGLGIDTSSYAFVVLDWRGFYGSAAATVPGADRGQDGYDAVEWITAQSWSNGKVATWGPSALGGIQFQTAKYNPPGLICAVPLVAGMQTKYDNYYEGGALRREYLDQLDALGYGVSPLVLAHPTQDFYWSYAEGISQYHDSIRIPMFMIGGWYDHNIELMLEDFELLRSSSDPSVRDAHKLMMGPWAHGGHGSAVVGSSMQGQLDYPAAAGFSNLYARRFLDFYMLGTPNSWDTTSAVTYFRMGNDFWQAGNSFPPLGVSDLSWYLQDGGSLQMGLPTMPTSESVRTYDPRDPSPTVGGSTLRLDLDQGPYDQAPVVESRSDVIVFTSDTLTSDVVVSGAPYAEMWVSSDQLDTDVCVRLTDVYPDGRSMLVHDGVRRMRFRSSFSTPTLMTPGTHYLVTVQMPHTCLAFESGHRIRLDVTFSNYPRFDANDNSGGAMYVPGDTFVATNRIYHNSSEASRLVLPTLILTGTESPQQASTLRAWPNPTTGELHFVSNANTEVSLHDLHGRQLPLTMHQESPGHWMIDVRPLPQGIYLLRAGSETIRWVKAE